ncbi:ferredoxin [Acetobacterium sp.]|uniref:ferredoxin n=1 Tax=Acetobacterium sp. TaxID=1872094 RepID=UPI002F3E82A8
MKAIVDKETCIGCGLCESECPDLFELDEDSIAIVMVDVVPEEFESCALEALEECPVDAITLE